MILRGVGWTVGAVVVLFVWAIVGGRDVQRYRCNGALLEEDGETPASLFVEFTRYRFPTTLWADHDGMVIAEVPHGSSGLFNVRDIGAMLTLADFGEGPGGYWSELSYAIDVELRLGGKEEFKGVCEPLNWDPL